MRSAIGGLFFLALLLGGCTNLFTMYFATPLSWTEPLLCAGEGYSYESVFSSGQDEYGSFTAEDVRVRCSGEDVTGAARWTLFGIWTAGYFLLLAAWMAVVARRQAGRLPAPPTEMNISAGEADRLRELARTRKIEAVKQVREQTGAGLREAKEYIESLMAEK